MAIKNGASIINDVSGLRADKNMVLVAKKYKCPIIIMYSKDKTPRTSKRAIDYKDVIKTIKEFLLNQSNYAMKNGVNKNNIILDTGMGAFISTKAKYSYEIIARLGEFKEMGFKMLVGLSRKSFLGGEIKDRKKRAIPLTAIAYMNGASIIRTHDIIDTKGVFKHLKK